MICFIDRFTRIKFAAKYIDLFYVNLIYLFILAVRKTKDFSANAEINPTWTILFTYS